ncbi:MAG: Enolase [Streblomastix strix]|uniref:phosphopyruvate hydratase n=1 Tax=Streblomastix strix TaxID=222440 RepID=A0A5J4TKR5_9EUKA|nr:MAG: Enolase [Streblomastix strix]
MSNIKYLIARQIIDSRGIPTLECDVITSHALYRASVPAGAEVGQFEAAELRDEGDEYDGKSVHRAIEQINTVIAPALIGKSVLDQKAIDDLLKELDGTENKSKLGSNTLLAVSIAVCRAGAGERGIPLYRYCAELAQVNLPRIPIPCFNIINGGKHSGNKLPFQEIMIAPTIAENFAEAVAMGCEVYVTAKGIIKELYGIEATNVGNEAGFVPPVGSVKEALDIVTDAIQSSGYKDRFAIIIDVAANHFVQGEGGLQFVIQLLILI